MEQQDVNPDFHGQAIADTKIMGEVDDISNLKATFKIEEATIQEIRLAFQQKKLTSKQLVQYYLNAITELKPTLNAVIEENPDALSQAEQADYDQGNTCCCGCFSNGLDASNSLSLKGIPVMLKDNIATKDKLNTTSGSYALLGSVVPRDAGVVDRLRQAGAIILGKAGLTEWANFRSMSMPDGWSARGRGTVKNPYVLTTEPGGSSTGSAVSVAANLVTVSLGTETDRSIIEPCSISGVVGIKPTVGLTSRSGVIPISHRQDTIGPIGRTVSDAVYLLDVIVGYDPRDERTKEAAQYIPKGEYKQFLKSTGLENKRLGNLWHYFKDNYKNSPELEQCFQDHFSTMRKEGAILIEGLEVPDIQKMMDPRESGQDLALKYEFKRDLNVYLSNLLKSPIRSLADAIAFNKANPDLEKLDEYGQQMFTESDKTELPSDEYTKAIGELANYNKAFEKFMTENELDAIVAPEFFAATLLASGGYPGITVPAGFDPDGVPFGILFGGLKGSEPTLIEISYAFEQKTTARKPPKLAT